MNLSADELYHQSNYLQDMSTQPEHKWQLCPKCNGSGTHTVMLPGYVVTTNATCDLCNGKKIISSLTGLPPT